MSKSVMQRCRDPVLGFLGYWYGQYMLSNSTLAFVFKAVFKPLSVDDRCPYEAWGNWRFRRLDGSLEDMGCNTGGRDTSYSQRFSFCNTASELAKCWSATSSRASVTGATLPTTCSFATSGSEHMLDGYASRTQLQRYGGSGAHFIFDLRV